MKLRWKTLLIIVLVIASLSAVLLFALHAIMMNSVANVEQKTVAQDAQRVTDAFSSELDDLAATASDWAAWDDTYIFVQKGNQDYIQSNLADTVFINFRLNFMLFFNSSGLVYGEAFDLVNETAVPVSQDLLDHFASNDFLLVHENATSNKMGLIKLSSGSLAIVVSQPVVPSNREGPVRGTLIMGRFFDEREKEIWFEMVHLPLSFCVLDDSPLSSDFQEAYSSLSTGAPVFSQPLSKETLGGYVLLNDVYGSPVLIVRFDVPRDFYIQGLNNTIYVAFALALVGTISVGATMLLMEKFVLLRLSKLDKEVTKIGETGNFAARIHAEGDDELSRLAEGINRMLSAVEKAECALGESELRFRRITENMLDMVSLSDVYGVFQYCSPSTKKILGYSPQDLLGKSVFDFIHPDDLGKVKEAVQKALTERVWGKIEFRYKHNDGHYIWLETIGNLVVDKENQVIGAVFSARDITERKELEKKLQSTARHLQTLLETAREGIVTTDVKDNITFVNNAFVEIVGYPATELIGSNVQKLLDEKGFKKVSQETELRKKGKTSRYELTIYRSDKKPRVVQMSASPLVNETGEYIGSLGIVTDITEQKALEQRLKESEERFRGIAERSFDAIATVDLEGRINYASPSVVKVLGYPAEDVMGKSFLQYFSPVSLSNASHLFIELLQGKSIEGIQLELPRRDGSTAIVEINASPIAMNGNITGIQAVFRDITNRKMMEDALKESEKRYRTLFNSASDGLIYLDAEGKIVDVNEKAVELFGGSREELIGRKITELELLSSEDLQKMTETFSMLTGGQEKQVSLWLKNKKGVERYLEVSSAILGEKGKVTGIFAIARDSTERYQMQKKLEEYSQRLEYLVEQRTRQLKEAQDQLVKNEKLAAIGQAAAMVGHDLRNPLTGISGAAYYLKSKLGQSPDEKVREMLNIIEKDVQYANNIIGDLMEYSREIKLELAETTPLSLVQETLSAITIPKSLGT
ncbi:PAS domain S-box protein, partial [Candidatus Bathyarchaeota archaeon]|nr:PAS domain S-box protein [Candidatus Bathyarchaeota archaeon]